MNGITKNELTLKAPAKINLFLEVLGKRDDGYHDIYSLFQAVSLYDELRFRVIDDPAVRLSCLDKPDLPTDERNLVVKACRRVLDRFSIKSGLEIELTKRIPIAAGLGGGSSDAAAAIKACNILFNLDLDSREMAALSLEIGSDLPFFFSSGQALISGRGEIVQDSDFPLSYHLVLITPLVAVSTADAYRGLRIGLTRKAIRFNLHSCKGVEELVSGLRQSSNDFEEVHLMSYPEIGRIKDGLSESGSLLSRLSGSGPTVFGIFSTEPARGRVQSFCREDWHVAYASPVKLGST